VRGRLLDGSWDCPDNLHLQELPVDLTQNSGTWPDRQQTKDFDLMCNQTNHTNKPEASMAKVKRIKDLNDEESATS
jgi:hypothetical protein